MIRKVWSGERNLRFDGRHYRLAGAQSGPVPAHPIGIWLGVYGPRALELVGRAADGWVPSFRGEMQPIADMTGPARRRGRRGRPRPGQHPSGANVSGTITRGDSEGPFRGPVDQWVDELSDLVVTYGFDTFVLWAEGDDQLPRFAEEVVPATRASVAAARG